MKKWIKNGWARRPLALLVAFVLVLTMTPAAAFAETAPAEDIARTPMEDILQMPVEDAAQTETDAAQAEIETDAAQTPTEDIPQTPAEEIEQMAAEDVVQTEDTSQAQTETGAVQTLVEEAIPPTDYGTDGITKIKTAKGAVVGVYYKGEKNHFTAFDSYPVAKNVSESESSADYDIFDANIPLNQNVHIEAYVPGETAKTVKFTSINAAGSTVTLDLTPIAEWTPADNAYADDMYTNLGDSGTMSLSVGGVFDLDTFRVWQALFSVTENEFVEPEFVFEKSGDSVEINRIGSAGREQLHISAVSPGVSVIKITYNPIEYITRSGETLKFNGIDPNNTYAVVVNVEESVTDFSLGIEARNDFDTYYFDKTAGHADYRFTPFAGSSVRVHDPLNIAAWGDGWTDYTADTQGAFSVELKDGRNIVEVTNGANKMYRVIKAKGIDVTVENVTNPGQKFVAGDQAAISMSGIEAPVEKIAGLYNPGFLQKPFIRYTNGVENFDSNKSGQYDTLGKTFVVNYTLSDTTKNRLTGQIQGGGGFWGVGQDLGAHRNLPLVGIPPSASGLAPEMGELFFGALPEIELPIKSESLDLTLRVQMDDSGFYLADHKTEVASDLSEEHGYTDVFNGERATALDALVAAHLTIFGEASEDYLKVNSSGFVTTVFGMATSNFVFYVNDRMPGDGVFNPDPYMGGKSQTGYAIPQAELKNDDHVSFVILQDSFAMDAFSWFEREGQALKTVEAAAGEQITLNLQGYMAMFYGLSDPETQAAKTTPAEDAQLALVEIDESGGFPVGTFADIENAITDEEGMATVSFANAGTYILSAYDTSGYMPLIAPWLAITVKENPPAPDAPVMAERTTTSITLRTVSGAEYKRGADGAWQDAPTFAGLTPDTEYTFFLRMKETETAFVSPQSSGAVFRTSPLPDEGGPTDEEPTPELPPPPIPVAGVSLDITAHTMETGGSVRLTAAVYPADATDKAVVWSSSDNTVAAVYGGLVTALKSGSAVITAAAGGKSVSCTILVTPAVTSVKFGQKSINLVQGKTATVSPVVYTSEGLGAPLIWASSNRKVATVTASGKIKGIKAGSARITATAKNGRKATLTVKVVAKSKVVKVSSVKIGSAPKTMKVGKIKQLKATVRPVKATGAVVKWRSSNSRVLKVDQAGRVTALKAGKANITLSVGGKSVRVTIQVKR